MATNAQAQALGFTTPLATDLIRDGDDAISQNARAAVDLYRSSMILTAAAAGRAAAERLASVETLHMDPDTGRIYYAPGLPAPVISDHFDRPDSATVGATPIGYKQLQPGTGSRASQLGIVAGELAFTSAPLSAGIGLWDTSRTDFTVGITATNVGASGGLHGHGLIFRAADTTWSTCYTLDGNGTGTGTSVYRITRRIDDSQTIIATNLGTPANGDRLEVECRGDRITVRINGETRFDADQPGGPMGTRVGVFLYQQRYQVRYDDLTVTP